MDNFSIENIYYLGPKGSNVNLAMLKFIELCNINYQNIIPVKSIKGVLEAHKKDLQYFDNLDESIKQLKAKKISGSSDLVQLSKNLDDFLNKYSGVFKTIQKAKYNEAF